MTTLISLVMDCAARAEFSKEWLKTSEEYTCNASHHFSDELDHLSSFMDFHFANQPTNLLEMCEVKQIRI